MRSWRSIEMTLDQKHPLVAKVLIGLAILISLASSAFSQPASDEELVRVSHQIDAAQNRLQSHQRLSALELQTLQSEVRTANAVAAEVVEKLTPRLTELDLRIAELGASASASNELSADQRRSQLFKTRSDVDAQLKLARLLGIESKQIEDQLWSLRRLQFQNEIGARTNSILTKAFWAGLAEDWPSDSQRLEKVFSELSTASYKTPDWVWAGMPAALASILATILWLYRKALNWIISGSPAGRLRRSLYALLVITASSTIFGVTADATYEAINWARTLPDYVEQLLRKVASMLWFAGFIYGLFTALICKKRPSWRRAHLPDAVAEGLGLTPALLTLVTMSSWIAEQLLAAVNASVSTTIAVNCIVALVLGVGMTYSLMHAEHIWHRELSKEGAAARPLWRSIVALASWLILIVAVISLLTGYVAFGSFAVQQTIWATIVIGAAYLVSALVDDLLTAWVVVQKAAIDAANTAGSSATPSIATISQVAVLASGALRLIFAAVSLLLLAAPFGESPSELLQRTGHWNDSLSIGDFSLRLGLIFQGILVFLLSILAVRILKAWLSQQYLPSTTLDPSMRLSAETLFGYAGTVIAIALTLSAMGIGLERIAWVASALSVGIGFGLQAVVQNFVSGLIMLAERPVKVGDWVSLDGVEGDIRRINVRATEIQMSDHSTLIIPNSAFITKIVRNMTLADPIGLVQIKIPVPFGADAELVREIILTVLTENTNVLESPLPTAMLDGIENGALLFNATGYVDSPRKSSKIRSELLFETLKKLAEAGVQLSKPPAVLVATSDERGSIQQIKTSIVP